MHADFSRVTFDPARRFSAVLSQQGRVQLDSEINEQSAILLHYLRTLAADLLGPAAYPSDADDETLGGFGVDAFDGENFTLAPGRMYVDGILCECDGTDYWKQPDGHLDPERESDRLPNGPFLVYLRVWERLVTAVEAPGIREVALGLNGPDTAARTQVVWQVCWMPLEAHAFHPDMRSATRYLRERLGRMYKPRGLLAARARRPEGDGVPCDLSPSSGYRGPENQLYRVEVHQAGTAETARFKWSRENGSVVLPIRSVSGPSVELETLGRDDKLGLEIGDVVEIVDDASVCRAATDNLAERSPRLYTIKEVDHAGFRVLLDAQPAGDPHHPTGGRVPEHHPYLRRWDQGAAGWGSRDGGSAEPVDAEWGLPVLEGEWLSLEDGIEVRFERSDSEPRTYRRGDHWLIPARVLTGDVEWPTSRSGRPASRTPHGIDYRYAALALLQPYGDSDYRMVDLRVPIPQRR
ncbi:hypothetical protein J7E88_32490 [Streptomyces sp. ISL-10]|uniref:DUF6519 domain-containing protein n=1 Tax=Streptomyces sp. ISL-10 TaxID=2819172 RepID=UPI001BE5F954|nr:DUF6519 domain-containing protein [Streptomyces sp. ISL-10]MBT2369865.1 hypothetical protein [Streptomyces sp. ISL-10]